MVTQKWHVLLLWPNNTTIITKNSVRGQSILIPDMLVFTPDFNEWNQMDVKLKKTCPDIDL